MRYVLVKPIVIDGNKDAPPLTITELVFREEICAGDLRGISMATIGDQPDGCLKLASRLSGQPDAVINRMGMKDTAAVLEVVAGFLDPSPKTGIDPSL